MKPPGGSRQATSHTDAFNIISDRIAQNRKPKSRWGVFFDKTPKKKALNVPVVLQPTVPREPVFSARLGNRSRLAKSSSEESLCMTDISLLTTSFVDRGSTEEKKKKRRKKGWKTPSSESEIRVSSATKSTSSATNTKINTPSSLDKMMISGATSHNLAGLAINTWEEDEEARQLRWAIVCCSRHNVILSKGKSLSTCTLSVDPTPLPHQKIKRPLKRSQSTTADLDILTENKNLSMLNFKNIKKQTSNLTTRLKFSAFAAGRQALTSNSAKNRKSKIPGKLTKLVHGIMGIALDKRASETAKAKIKKTIDALELLTGYGDPQAAGVNFCLDQDNFKYIQEDFSHIPYYPQRVKIAPQLTTVIKEDIGVRMGRPKYHQLSEEDIATLEIGFQKDTYHRNLMIFNWLMSLEEDHFENYQNIVVVDPAEVERTGRENERILRRRLSKSASVLPLLNYH